MSQINQQGYATVIPCQSCGQLYPSLSGHLCSGAQPQAWQQPVPYQNPLHVIGGLIGVKAMVYANNRYLVVCNGAVHELPEAATLEAAQSKAEELAHSTSSDAFVLKPVRKVSPKRDVVVTELP